MNVTNLKSNISVVIASLGGDVLTKTLHQLNDGLLKPDEIIVVIPKEFENNVFVLFYSNVNYVFVPFKGQVAQRVYGFKLAKNNFVLQLDDDIYLDQNCLEKLVLGLKSLGPGHSVGPSIFFKETGLSVYPMSKGFQGFAYNIKSFMSGSKWGTKRMGTISRNGSGFGLDFHTVTDEFNHVEWLAGGCILHFKSELILNDYFPFVGKAYGEDLIHSWFLTDTGVKLYNIKSAICYIETPILNDQNYSLKSDFKSRLYLNKLRKVPLLYTYFWFVSRLILSKLVK